MSELCTTCFNTGISNHGDGAHYDCVHCSAAEERMRLDAWCKIMRPHQPAPDAAWLIYLAGKSRKFEASE